MDIPAFWTQIQTPKSISLYCNLLEGSGWCGLLTGACSLRGWEEVPHEARKQSCGASRSHRSSPHRARDRVIPTW